MGCSLGVWGFDRRGQLKNEPPIGQDILFLSDGLCGSSCDTAARTAYMLSQQLAVEEGTPKARMAFEATKVPGLFLTNPNNWLPFAEMIFRVFPLVGVERNLSLLEIFFPGVLTK